MACDQRLEGVRVLTMKISGGRTFQAEGMASDSLNGASG